MPAAITSATSRVESRREEAMAALRAGVFAVVEAVGQDKVDHFLFGRAGAEIGAGLRREFGRQRRSARRAATARRAGQ